MTAMGLPWGRFNLVACFIESSSGEDRGHHTRRAFFPEQLDSDREFCTSIVRLAGAAPRPSHCARALLLKPQNGWEQ